MSVARDFAFQRWVERAYARQERPLDFRAQTVAEWRTWRARLREKIETLAGMVPPPRPAISLRRSWSARSWRMMA